VARTVCATGDAILQYQRSSEPSAKRYQPLNIRVRRSVYRHIVYGCFSSAPDFSRIRYSGQVTAARPQPTGYFMKLRLSNSRVNELAMRSARWSSTHRSSDVGQPGSLILAGTIGAQCNYSPGTGVKRLLYVMTCLHLRRRYRSGCGAADHQRDFLERYSASSSTISQCR